MIKYFPQKAEQAFVWITSQVDSRRWAREKLSALQRGNELLADAAFQLAHVKSVGIEFRLINLIRSLAYSKFRCIFINFIISSFKSMLFIFDSEANSLFFQKSDNGQNGQNIVFLFPVITGETSYF